MCGYEGTELERRWVKARRPHRCYACRRTITPGDLYHRTAQVFDGKPSAFKLQAAPSEGADAMMHRCSDCGEAFLLLSGWRCAQCWRVAGEPSAPSVDETAEQRLNRENAIRAGMTARGSTGRHLVRSGRT